MIVTFFHIKGIVHFEFIPQGQTANQACYMEILTPLRETTRRKRPELWPNDWILRHNNSSAHKVLSVKHFWAQTFFNEMKQPHYSPDLAPNDFRLFPKIKPR
jgi:hypothetical protein